jgi:pyruvate/2-oxoglutarate dehydrogenase complex dihydrolipoamide dehydrogenase (E3) component
VSGRVVVLGGGAVAQAFLAALRRHDEGVPVTLVESHLVGGECTYYACMPSKTLLRAPEVVAEARRAPGAAEAVTGEIDPGKVFWWRDQVVDSYDDSGMVSWVQDLNVDLVRGRGRVAEPGVVEVAGERIEFEKLVLATGSSAAIPPIDGLDTVEYWTSRDATSSNEIPESMIVLGAGPVGCELAQFYSRMGTRVTIVDRSERLLPRDDPEAGELLAAQFRSEGIELRFESGAQRIEGVEGKIRVHTPDGETVDAEKLLVATGRRANTQDLGLEQLGVEIARQGVQVDERLRAAENVWAIGDVNGIAMFTHVGKYQARVAAADVAGLEARADYRAIPAATFTDPQVASVGRPDGDGLVTSKWALPARASTFERPRSKGFLKLVADPQKRVVVGATAVGPDAGEWLQQLTLAIRAEVPVEVLRDTIQPYPTFSEAVVFAARDLPL